MANSGIYWIDTIFDWAVVALIECAKFLGMTYEEINVWIFCVAWPLITLILFGMVVKLWRDKQKLMCALAQS
jgi:hypothetical protein